MNRARWAARPLGKCAKLLSGGTPNKDRSEFWEGDIPWVSSGEMAELRIYDTPLHISEQGAIEGSRLVPANTVLAVVRGMSLAKEFRVSITKREVAFNQDLKAFACEPDVDPEFLFYSLLAHRSHIRELASEASHGTKRLETNILSEFEILVPRTQDEQHRVVHILSAYDDLIENNRRRMGLLEEAARQLYREWFVRLRFPGHEHTRKINGVLEGWERIYLGDACDTQYGYTETATNEPVGPKFLRGTDINKTAYIDWSTVPYCPIDELRHRKYQLRVGDIVIIRMADPGKVAIIEREIDAVFASYLIRLLPTDARLTPYYLFYVLSDDAYQGFISGVSTGSTRKAASAPLLVDFHLFIPPQTLLRTFEDAVRPIRQQITTLLIQNEKLRAARDLLLSRLISGEITD